MLKKSLSSHSGTPDTLSIRSNNIRHWPFFDHKKNQSSDSTQGNRIFQGMKVTHAISYTAYHPSWEKKPLKQKKIDKCHIFNINIKNPIFNAVKYVRKGWPYFSGETKVGGGWRKYHANLHIYNLQCPQKKGNLRLPDWLWQL